MKLVKLQSVNNLEDSVTYFSNLSKYLSNADSFLILKGWYILW